MGIKRPTKRVTNTGQQGFGFPVTPAPAPREPQPLADDRFQDDDPYSVFVGEQRVDAYLRDAGMGWVLELRRVLGQLDYSMLTARYSRRGRQAFHPRTVLGLMIYTLFVRQQGLREMERLSTLDLGAMWICGGHRIDHSTIGKFWRQHAAVLSQEFFEATVAWIVRQMQLRPGVSSIDGTVVEAAASHWRAIRAEAAQQQADEAQRAAAAAPEDPARQAAATATAVVAAVAQERCARRAAQGKPTATVAVVPSEPEAVIQPRKDGTHRPSYKPSTLMHESGVILGQYVHPSSETAAVVPLLDQHTALFGAPPPTLLMDAGYHHGPLLGEVAARGIDVLCPAGQAMGSDDWEKKGAKGLFGKSQFRFDAARDGYQCPAGELLTYTDRGTDARGRAYRRFRTAACAGCALRAQCTQSRRGRSVQRYAGDEYKEAMQEVLQQPRARAMYARRLPIGEPVHAELRERFGLRRFHRFGLAAVRGEFAVYCLAFNLKKALGRRAMVVIIVVSRLPDASTGPEALVWAIAVLDAVHGA